MDEIPTRRPAGRPYINRRRNTQPLPRHHSYKTTSSRPNRKKRARRAAINNVPPALRAQAAELRAARANLLRCYDQEQNVLDMSARFTGITINIPSTTAARERAERRYVNCIIRYLRNTNKMSSVEAVEMQGNFTRQKMKNAGMTNRTYLLRMYPRELN
jgi:hypothetical protein